MYNYLTYLIKSVDPTHQEEDVLLDKEIRISFTEPLDPLTVNDSNFWVIKNGTVVRIPGTVSYETLNGEFYITFVATQNLEQNTTYSVTVRGESEIVDTVDEIDEGIKTAFGRGICGNYTWTFTTGIDSEISPVNLLYPSDKSSGEDTPEFRWSNTLNADIYDIVISNKPSFERVIFQTSTVGLKVTPIYPLPEGEYWWKVKARNTTTLEESPWSNTFSFYKGKVDNSVIAPEDVPMQLYPLINTYRSGQRKPAVVNSFPAGVENVSLNLGYIALEVDGYIDPMNINNKSFKLIGEPYNVRNDMLDGQQWWNKSIITPPVSYIPNKAVSDKVRKIYTHGDVPMTRMSVYDPKTDKTIIIGVFDDPQMDYTAINREQILNTNIEVRNDLYGIRDGINNTFLLPQMPISSSLRVFVDGEYTTDYNSVSMSITFVTPPTVNARIEAVYNTGYVVRETPSGVKDNSNTAYELSVTPASGTLTLYKNDAYMLRDYDYLNSGIFINMLTPLISTDLVYAEYQLELPFVVNEQIIGTIDGSNVLFNISHVPYQNSEQLFKNGLLLRRDVDYTISSNIITFAVPPTAGDKLFSQYFLRAPQVVGEIPLGDIDNVNDTYVLANFPHYGTLDLFKDGLLVSREDYEINVNEITMATPVSVGSWLMCNYITNEGYRLPYPVPTEINYLLPNNKYTICFNTQDCRYTSNFVSQYWPIFAEPDDIRPELEGIVELNDRQLYNLIRNASIEAIHIPTSPMHYINDVGYDYSDTPIPYDPNDPAYCVHMFVKYKVALNVLQNALVKYGIQGGGEKMLGDLNVKKGLLSGPAIKEILGSIKDKLRPWEDCLYGHHKRGMLHVRNANRGINNHTQYQSDYPLKSRTYSPKGQIPSNKWRWTV